jgi:hypothetical protein
VNRACLQPVRTGRPRDEDEQQVNDRIGVLDGA